MRKDKTIKFTNGWSIISGGKSFDAYRVEEVTNSVEFAPGELIGKSGVESLCGKPDWTVKIIQRK